MAVYTKIDKDDIRLINNKFNIEKIINFQGIKQGIENTNYLLKSKNKKFILTIFEKRVSEKEIPFFMKLMDNLNRSKINCPKPLRTKNNSEQSPSLAGNKILQFISKHPILVNHVNKRKIKFWELDFDYVKSNFKTL